MWGPHSNCGASVQFEHKSSIKRGKTIYFYFYLAKLIAETSSAGLGQCQAKRKVMMSIISMNNCETRLHCRTIFLKKWFSFMESRKHPVPLICSPTIRFKVRRCKNSSLIFEKIDYGSGPLPAEEEITEARHLHIGINQPELFFWSQNSPLKLTFGLIELKTDHVNGQERSNN